MLRRNETFDLKEFYLIAITIYMAMSFSMSEAKITLLVGYASILVGILCVFWHHKILRGISEHILVLCIAYMFFIIFYVLISQNSLLIRTTKGRLIGTIIIYMELSLSSLILWGRVNRNKINIIFYFLTVVAVVYSLKVYSLQEFLFGLQGIKRLGAEICGINSFGMYFSLLSLFFFYKILDNVKYRYINIVCWGGMFVFAAASGSRKALLGSIIGAVLLELLSSDKRRLKTILKIMLIGGILFYILSLLGVADGIFSRLSSSNDLASESDLIRKNMIHYAIQGWKEHLIFGNGFNSFIEISHFRTYAHNNYVELLFDIGIIGTVLFYIPKVYILIRALFIYRKEKDDVLLNFWIVEMVILLAFDFACVSYYDILLNFFWWLASAYIVRKTVYFRLKNNNCDAT